MQGWIKLHRQIMDSAIWNCEPFSKGQAWIDLLMLANHKPAKIMFNNQLFEVKTGQHMTSLSVLSVKWKWSRSKTKRFIEWLSDEQMINVEQFKSGTLLTVINYEVYQGQRNTDEQATIPPTEQQTEHQRTGNDTTHDTTDGTPTDTNKNDKKYKNVRKKESKNNIITPLTPLSGEEGEDYDFEKHSNVENAKHFLNYTKDYEHRQYLIDHKDLADVIMGWFEFKDNKKPRRDNHYQEQSIQRLLTEIVNKSKSSGIPATKQAIESTIARGYMGITWDLMDKSLVKKNNNSLEDWLKS